MAGEYGLLMLAVGLPLAVFPYRISKLQEQLDAVGSKRSSAEVEPAGWKVLLNRVLGVVLAVAGAGALVVG